MDYSTLDGRLNESTEIGAAGGPAFGLRVIVSHIPQ
jgi:hypothetical protein